MLLYQRYQLLDMCVFNTKGLRKILRVSSTAKKTNEWVLMCGDLGNWRVVRGMDAHHVHHNS